MKRHPEMWQKWENTLKIYILPYRWLASNLISLIIKNKIQKGGLLLSLLWLPFQIAAFGIFLLVVRYTIKNMLSEEHWYIAKEKVKEWEKGKGKGEGGREKEKRQRKGKKI